MDESLTKRWKLTEEDITHQCLAFTCSCTHTCTIQTSHAYIRQLLNVLQAPILCPLYSPYLNGAKELQTWSFTIFLCKTQNTRSMKSISKLSVLKTGIWNIYFSNTPVNQKVEKDCCSHFYETGKQEHNKHFYS